MKYHTPAVTLDHVWKQYTIHHEKPTIVETFMNGKTETFVALRNITLSFEEGEKVGIIGPNGSGKTTLLKLIAGITAPTRGTLTARGKIVSLIDLEAGFHTDLTGIENIYLNGMLLGMKKSDIAKKIGRIIRFADIGRFIDAPLFTYSNGMTLRLGFAVAVHADPDIIIIDEQLSVGDHDFRKKSESKLKELFRAGKTIIVVSHELEFLNKNCERIIVLRHGQVVADGPKNLIRAYQKKAL